MTVPRQEAGHSHCKMVRLPQPVLTNTELDTLCNIRYKGFNTEVLPILFEKSKGVKGMSDAIENLCKEAEKSVDAGINYIILSDRGIDDTHAAIPSLLAVSAIHHYLVSIRKRVQTALIVESGEIREVMHVALLMGYGASAVNPYMAFAVIDDLVKKGEIQLDYETAQHKVPVSTTTGHLVPIPVHCCLLPVRMLWATCSSLHSL